jgi:signal transduction histidine kinase
MLTPSVVAPTNPTPPETIAAAVERIGPLHGLPLEDRLWLAEHGEERTAKAGSVLFEEGAPVEHMMLILKGEVHVRRNRGGPMTLFIGRTGQMTGLLPYSRMKGYGGQGFAVTDVWALLIHKRVFPEMLRAIPSMGQRVVATLLDRVREVTRIEQQAEKLTALGKLAGNLAHELNNPASAAQRAASNLAAELRALREQRFQLVNLCLNESQIAAVEAWEQKVLTRQQPAPPEGQTHAVAQLGPEEAIRSWLTNLGCAEPWDIAAQLAEQGVTNPDLEELRASLGSTEVCISLHFFARYLRSTRSVDTMVTSSARIFDLISAIKAYSFMDRAPILEVDLPEGLDATLQMLHSRMEKVEVIRDYEPGLPRISAYASELNQVWTALIENALDALGNEGTLRISCRMESEMLLVEIWDSGPGIPAELQDRIFEPFFTTKAPGLGLGLGLDNAMRIVRKHSGHLSVESKPGSTRFCVRLPFDQLQAY